MALTSIVGFLLTTDIGTLTFIVIKVCADERHHGLDIQCVLKVFSDDKGYCQLDINYVVTVFCLLVCLCVVFVVVVVVVVVF